MWGELTARSQMSSRGGCAEILKQAAAAAEQDGNKLDVDFIGELFLQHLLRDIGAHHDDDFSGRRRLGLLQGFRQRLR